MEKTSQFQKIQKQVLEQFGLLYTLARTGHYALQGLPLPYIDRIATGKKRPAPKEFTEHLKDALGKIKNLHLEDINNIKNGLYPVDVLYPENFLTHAYRYTQLLRDSFQISKRRNIKKSKDFSNEKVVGLADLPAYYARNFHYQTDGYLSEESAELYEHQVEILFSGAADPMRRLILPPLKKHFVGSGKGLHFLEIGSGTGRLTRSLALAYPDAHLTCVDLSSVYLKKAEERLKNFNNINYCQAPAEILPFKSCKFDAVVSCFLFHELPFEIRKQVLSECMRVTKSNGFIGMVDSIQKNDDAEFQWALKQFPVDFHEPFYKNYVSHPMEDLMSAVGLKRINSQPGFLSKAVSGVKKPTRK